MAKVDLTAQRLREILSYDPSTGLFHWLLQKSNCIKAGGVAGTPSNSGYLQIGVDGHKHLAHRLAWLHVHGVWPSQQIDHINGNRIDNRMQNLRDVSSVINSENRTVLSRRNTSGITGVSWNIKNQKWLSRITHNGKITHIGLFDCKDDARQAYLDLKRRLHPGCTI